MLMSSLKQYVLVGRSKMHACGQSMKLITLYHVRFFSHDLCIFPEFLYVMVLLIFYNM